MRCELCHIDNRDDRIYCASCGVALNRKCGACNFTNEATDRFCGGCGKPITKHSVETTESLLFAGHDGVRRPVTVLFCDLVGYSSMSTQLDPEDVHALLERYFALVDSLVEQFGGSIDKHIGDAVMALFGAPVAHGNDSERAVLSALDIHAAISDLALDLAAPLAVHIGIATGEVVASSVGSHRHRGYTVTGEAANIAARLLEVAKLGETLVSDRVYRATEQVATYEPVGPLALKGLNKPLSVWRLKGTARSRDASPSRLVGRRSELAQIRAVLGSCIAEASGATVLVRGEAGMGKTRLIDEVKAIATTLDMSRLSGVILDFGTARGHGAVRTIVAGLIDVDPDAALAELERAVAVASGDLPADSIHYLRDLLEVPQPPEDRKLYEAIDATARLHGKDLVATALIMASAARRPLLVTIEDLHWADSETLGLVTAMARATAACRVVLVLTTRPEGDPLDPRWRSTTSGGPLVTLDLSPLSAVDALSIAHHFINAEGFAAQCIARAGGNPLFLEQLLQSAGDLIDGQLPASIQSVVLARTDLLGTADRRAIQAASVLGQRFSLSTLRQLLEVPSCTCDMLIRNLLLRPSGDGLQFAHALVRDGVYGSITFVRRRELHKAAAAILSDDLVLRAEHLDLAGDAAVARAYFEAALEQKNLFRNEQAMTLATRGLTLAGLQSDIVDLALLLGDLRLEVGPGTEALAAYERALSAATTEANRCRALRGCAAADRQIARPDAAFLALSQAEPLAESIDDQGALAEIHYLRGALHFAQGHLVDCRGQHELALAAARRLGSPDWQARALSGLADAQYMDCRMATALRHFSQCLELCDRHGLTGIAVPNRVMMGHCRIYTCEIDVGLADMRAAYSDAVRIGNRHAQMFAEQSQGFSLTAAGRYAEAKPLHESGLSQARALKARRYEVVLLAQKAEGALVEGEFNDARLLAMEGQQISDETGPGFAGPIICGLLALIEERRDAQEIAIKTGEAMLANGAVGHNHFWFRRYAIERALLARSWDEVDRHADALELRTGGEPLSYASILAERGHILARQGRGTTTADDETKLEALLATAARGGVKADALGLALRAR